MLIDLTMLKFILRKENKFCIQTDNISKVEREARNWAKNFLKIDKIKTGLRNSKEESLELNIEFSPLISWMTFGKLLHIYVP